MSALERLINFYFRPVEVRAVLNSIDVIQEQLREWTPPSGGAGIDFIKADVRTQIVKNPNRVIGSIRNDGIRPTTLAALLLREAAWQAIAYGQESIFGHLTMRGNMLRGVFNEMTDLAVADGFCSEEHGQDDKQALAETLATFK